MEKDSQPYAFLKGMKPLLKSFVAVSKAVPAAGNSYLLVGQNYHRQGGIILD